MTSFPVAPVPQLGILEISPYVAGTSTLAGIEKVIKLSSNENAWGPSPNAIEAFRASVDCLYKYPDATATALRQAIGDVYNLPPDHLMMGTGSDEILNLVAYAYAGVGDEVIYARHSFLVYPIAARSVGATPVPVDEKEGFILDVDATLKAVTPRTKIVYVCNPNNPTGVCVPLEQLKRLHAGLRPDIIMVIDGAYAEFVQMEGFSAGEDLVRDSENVIMTRTFSKVYGLAGLRVGWVYAPPAIIDVFNRIRGPFNVNLPALAMAESAVRDIAWTADIVNKTIRERKRIETALQTLGLSFVPSETNFLLVHFTGTNGKTAEACDIFLKSKGIIIRRMESYGLPDYLRISVGTEPQNDALLNALTAFKQA
jgi:histidinol-phosphate aminotransferase